MSLWGKLSNFLFGDDNKEEVKPRSKIPRNIKLIDKGKIRPRTKYIIENQISNELDEFNKRVNECKTWLNSLQLWQAPYSGYVERDIIDTIGKLNKNELLALRVASLEYYSTYCDDNGVIVFREIEEALKSCGHKYIFKKGKR